MKIQQETKTTVGTTTTIRSSCHFIQDSKCDITGIDCRYGLTEIYVPKLCPLRAGPITQVTRLK